MQTTNKDTISTSVPERPRWLANWLARHQNPISFWLHMVGIPLTIAAIPIAIVQLSRAQWEFWWRPVALFIAGYFLQWVGHLIEGNDMGELILIKKLRGKPYIAIAPRYAASDGEPSNRSTRADATNRRP